MRTKPTKVKEVDKSKKELESITDASPSLIGKERSRANLKKPWKKGESGNPKGPPKRRTIAVCNAELVAEGYTPATKYEIEQLYMSLVNVDETKLDQIALDKTLPMLKRIVARNMKGGKGFDVIERMIDRSHGKAVQKEEVKHTGTVGIVDTSKMTSAELDKYIAGISG